MSRKEPSYRLHKSSGQALVQLNGHRIYLGKYNSAKSREKYHRLLAEWSLAKERFRAAGGDRAVDTAATAKPADFLQVIDLIHAFLQHVKQRYRKNGKPTSEVRSFKTALRPVRRLYESQPVNSFGPLALAACRDALVAHRYRRRGDPADMPASHAYCRRRINGHLGRVRAMFKWGVSQEMVRAETWQALLSVEGVRPGQAPERSAVRPVSLEHVQAVEPFVTPQIWAILQFQLATGCRPGEAVLLRSADIDRSGPVWEFRPHSHKIEHHDLERVVYVGPQGQAILADWLASHVDDEYLFQPREARSWSYRHRRRQGPRKTPAYPCEVRRVAAEKCKRRQRSFDRAPSDCYSVLSYDTAIRRACKKAGVPHWTPNQLRHTAGTKIRKKFGVEVARIILGHTTAFTTEIYAEADREKAIAAISSIG